ncbi:MAG TPA: diacylglycerol kinase family protein [Anaeromyxobacter sp.]
MADRLLLLVNTASGTGHPAGLVPRLRAIVEGALGPGRSELAPVADHAAAKRLARDFVARTPGVCAVVVGGGNGTLRAAIEGIASAAEAEGSSPADRAVVAALRLGSGNLFARHFGAPVDPEAALRGILENLVAGRLTRCVLVRCDVEDADGGRRTLHATSLVGFGAFGGVPAALARWHAAHPRLHRALARLAGIERLTRLEYAVAFAARALGDALSRRARPFRVVGGAPGATLVAGAIVKLGQAALPLPWRIRPEDPAMALALLDRLPVPALLRGLLRPRRLARRARVSTLSPGECVRLERTGRAPVELFLDEDPESFGRALEIRLADTLPVAPGPDYRWPALPEVA